MSDERRTSTAEDKIMVKVLFFFPPKIHLKVDWPNGKPPGHPEGHPGPVHPGPVHPGPVHTSHTSDTESFLLRSSHRSPPSATSQLAAAAAAAAVGDFNFLTLFLTLYFSLFFIFSLFFF